MCFVVALESLPICLADVESASKRLEPVAVRTPLVTNPELDRRLEANVFLKAENLQHIGAFKFRGAYNRMVQLSNHERKNGVVAFSSGNHAQGVAYAARLLGMQATIVMPSDAPEVKKKGTASLGATIRLYDRETESREEIASDIASKTGAVLVPAFDDPEVMAGQGTCGLEIMRDSAMAGWHPDIVISPCGGGGLLSGLATAVKGSNPQTHIYGVEPEFYNDHFLSKNAGRRIRIEPLEKTSCDSLMATTPGELTWLINKELVDDFLIVTEEDIARAVSFAARYLKLVVEPGGAAALAAILARKVSIKNKKVVVILSGGNIDQSALSGYLRDFSDP